MFGNHLRRIPDQVARLLVGNAIACGELAVETDLELAELLAAPIYWRMVITGGRSDAAYLDRAGAAIVAALGACHDHRHPI